MAGIFQGMIGYRYLAVAQKTGIPKWVALVSGHMVAKTCGLPLLFNFEPHPFALRVHRFFLGFGVVRGGPKVRFHEGSTRVPPGFHQVLRGLRGDASTKKSTAYCWGYHLSLLTRYIL